MENLPYRIVRRVRRDFRALLLKTRDCFTSTYTNSTHSADKLAHIFSFLDNQFLDRLASQFPDYPALVRKQAQDSIAHCFNLLGSGPLEVKHGMICPGLNGFSYRMSTSMPRDQFERWLDGAVNPSNLVAAKEIWRLVDDWYTPIDWQVDFKTGFRWNERTWYRDISFGKVPGVDVKVPWELSRMQHLPTVALAALFAKSGFLGFEHSDRYVGEFRNQVLDFIATNPPRFGVNWVCTMDVAIRVSNWLLAYDIIVASGIQLDEEFKEIFVRSVRSHARHISDNLEWSPVVRGNHYIANILGLLFSSLYLPCDRETNKWLLFSIRELVSEAAYQFHEDGSNFEGSVCYHRLSAEMITWASALISNLDLKKRDVLKSSFDWMPIPFRQLESGVIKLYKIPGTERDTPLPEWFWERLAKMACFTDALTKPDGMVTQFGDNDSGRFILMGSGEQLRANNDPSSELWSLDHRSLIASIKSVIGHEIGTTHAVDDPAALFLGAISGNVITNNITIKNAPLKAHNDKLNFDDAVWCELKDRFTNTPAISRFTSSFAPQRAGCLLEKMECQAFPGMGVYVMRNKHFHLAVRCGEIGLGGLGGHTHCDQLAIEIFMDGRCLVRDPGSLFYTAMPEIRNVYRSSLAHNVPRVIGKELARLDRGIFDLRDCVEGECLYFGKYGFIGCHSGYGELIYRIIEVKSECIQVHDFVEGGLLISNPTPIALPFSQGYGRMLKG